MQEYAIESKKGQKGRSFRATPVAMVTANALWDEGLNGKTIRPVWAMFAGTEQQLRPFVANLKAGRKAEPSNNHRGGDDDRLEFLRSVGFVTSWQREPEGSLVTLFHPELFRLDPGLVDPQAIRFVLLVPADWSDAQGVDVTSAVRHVHSLAPQLDVSYLSRLVPTAYLFAAYLDRRTRCPLVADGRFYLQLLVAALDVGFASLPGSDLKYNPDRGEWGHHRSHCFNVQLGGSYDRLQLGDVGLAQAISFKASHESFESFLAEQVTSYFARVKGGTVSERVDLSAFSGMAVG